jgi:hypothetical protein
VNPLLAELTDEQARLLGLIHDEFEQHVRWPIWQYLDLTLTPPLGTAEKALVSLPQVSDTRPMGRRYRLVSWMSSGGTSVPSADTPMALTIAGVHHVRPDRPLSELWIRFLQHLITQQSQLRPSPTEVVTCTVSDKELARLVASRPGDTDAQARLLGQLRLLLDQEPVTQSRVEQPHPPDGPWTVKVPPDILRYEGVENVDQYVERLTDILTPDVAPYSGSAVSSLSLPQAISYLDAVWQARVGKPLFVNLDASSVEKLSLAVTSPAELDSWTSALADVLSHILVPPDDSIQRKSRRPVTVLGEWLAQRLPDPEAERANYGIDVLTQTGNVRVGAQHSASSPKAVKAFETLGLPFPPTDWHGTWTVLHQRVVGALDAIREEVQAGLHAGVDQTNPRA